MESSDTDAKSQRGFQNVHGSEATQLLIICFLRNFCKFWTFKKISMERKVYHLLCIYMDYSGHISLETLWGMYSIFFLLLLLPNDICKWKMSTIFFKKRIQIFYISINFRIHFCMCEKNHPNSSNYRHRQYTTNNVISSYILLGWLFAAYFKGI